MIVGPWASNIKFIGDIFLRLIQMSVVLLVMSAVAGAVGGGDGRDVGKMGFHTFKWIIGFTIFSAALGVVLAMLVKPGIGIDLSSAEEVAEATVGSASLQETLTNFVPTNVIQAMAEGSMVPCIVFALFFGVAMGQYTKNTKNRNVADLVLGLNNIITNIIKIVMTIAPIGIFCLLADVAGKTGFDVIKPMFKFLGILLVGDIIQFLVFGPLTAALCKVNLFKMPKKFAKMSMMAITTTSGAICLPTKMEDSVTKFGVSRRISDFVGPLAMSMNSNGAALCDLCYVMFLSQACGVTLTTSQIVIAVGLAILVQSQFQAVQL